MVECWTEVDRWAQKYRSVRLDAGSMGRLYDIQNWRYQRDMFDGWMVLLLAVAGW